MRKQPFGTEYSNNIANTAMKSGTSSNSSSASTTLTPMLWPASIAPSLSSGSSNFRSFQVESDNKAEANSNQLDTESTTIQVITTSKRKKWNEFSVEEIEEVVDEDHDDNDDDGSDDNNDDDDEQNLSNFEEKIFVISDQNVANENEGKIKSDNDTNNNCSNGDDDDQTALTERVRKNIVPQQLLNEQLQQQHLQRIQLKRKSYSSSIVSTNMLQRTISSSSTNSQISTVDESSHVTGDTDTIAQQLTISSIDSEEKTSVSEVSRLSSSPNHNIQQQQQQKQQPPTNARHAYARSISFSGVRSYHGVRTSFVHPQHLQQLQLQNQSSLIRRGLIFHRLDGRTLLPSISCE